LSQEVGHNAQVIRTEEKIRARSSEQWNDFLTQLYNKLSM
jgi:hypothetical protein